MGHFGPFWPVFAVFGALYFRLPVNPYSSSCFRPFFLGLRILVADPIKAHVLPVFL